MTAISFFDTNVLLYRYNVLYTEDLNHGQRYGLVQVRRCEGEAAGEGAGAAGCGWGWGA